MADLGTLTILTDDDNTFDTVPFISATCDMGWPSNSLQRVAEAITSMGVNGSRMRILREDYPRFTLNTVMAASSWDNAVIYAGYNRLSKGMRATLSITAGGLVYTFSNQKLFIWEVTAAPASAQVVSTVADPTTKALVSAAWTPQFIA